MGDEIIYIGLYFWCVSNLVNDEYSGNYCSRFVGYFYKIVFSFYFLGV